MRFHLKRTVWSFAFSLVILFLTDLIFFKNGTRSRTSSIVERNVSIQKTSLSNSTKVDRSIHGIIRISGNNSDHSTKVQGSSGLIWPNRLYYDNDRIVNQLKFKLKNQSRTDDKQKEHVPLKTIFIDSGFSDKPEGRAIFLEDKCKVNTCEITRVHRKSQTADAMFFTSSSRAYHYRKFPKQIWIMFMLESPYNTFALQRENSANLFNWTATYRHDSDIVAPYEKFVRYDENVKFLPQNKSYAQGKTKKVAWFVSNCGARNLRREYANQLSKFISVDIYGQCGKLKCPRKDKKCFEMLNTDYKFYLSFENSNCRDYITEKFFVTGLQHDVIPIVMGAAPEDYARAAPPHSFIHVDDFESPEKLAQYLHKLDQNDDLYNEYFRWKGTGSLINTFFWCRVCAMLHDTSRESHSYRDLEKWWRGDGVCIGRDDWGKRTRTSKFIADDYLA